MRVAARPGLSADEQWLAGARLHGGAHWLTHARCQVQGFEASAGAMPVTVTDGTGPLASYVFSARSAWLRYGIDEATGFLPPAWQGLGRVGLRLALSPLEGLLRASGLDHALIANNWLISTNLHPDLTADDWAGLEARAADARRPLLLRNVSDAVQPGLESTLRQRGWQLLPARKIWLADLRSDGLAQAHNLKIDQKLLTKSDLEWVPHERLQRADLPALQALFRALFIDKHSALNPDFTEAFFAFCLETRFLDLWALRENGTWRGVVGLYERQGWLTTPLLGYDTTCPAKLGLYRRLMARVAHESNRRHVRLHYSSGASQFKQMRGGLATLEYTACFVPHLPAPQRAAFAAFSQIVSRCLPPLLQRYG